LAPDGRSTVHRIEISYSALLVLAVNEPKRDAHRTELTRLLISEAGSVAELDAYMILKDDAGVVVPGETTDNEMSKLGAIAITSFTLKGEFSDTSMDEPSEQKSTPRLNDKLTLSVSKSLDSSSPALMIAYCYQLQTDLKERKPFKELTIIMRKAGDVRRVATSQTPYVKLIFEKVYLTSYSCGGEHSSNKDMPTENLGFRFKGVSMEYWPQMATGRLLSSSKKTMNWNFY
jgi:type VI protein secretion system component Hcp